jgi:RNA polymerase sigma-70 factor, ECF subfamily
MLPNLLVNTLYATYEAQLKRYAEGLTHDYDQADDLVQEAFIRAADHAGLLEQLDGPQQRSWLYTVVKNRFIDYLRAAGRRQAKLQALAELVTRDEPSTEYAGEINLFERVPGRFKSLLIERYVQGLTSDEIALKLHVPAATVRSRIRLAISWLRTHPDEWN